ncbi:hypothetical protein HOO65_010467 [Ceratocystis lukuohia]|uniref:SSCRP protein n=2 Tax=Ceratocystis TaxID=5157 RepID=A0A0F8BT85_CERFI|nr:hypothetical protein CFO_g1848 [Ceratocystis platani]
MKFSLASTLLAAVAAVSAAPSKQLDDRSTPAELTFRFHAAAAQYDLSFPADGQFHETGNTELNVNLIDTPGINAMSQCEFKTNGAMALAPTLDTSGNPQVAVGPPQPIIAVKCWGSCVPIYGDCFINGVPQGACCSGYCAANKCRPFQVSVSY